MKYIKTFYEFINESNNDPDDAGMGAPFEVPEEIIDRYSVDVYIRSCAEPFYGEIIFTVADKYVIATENANHHFEISKSKNLVDYKVEIDGTFHQGSKGNFNWDELRFIVLEAFELEQEFSDLGIDPDRVEDFLKNNMGWLNGEDDNKKVTPTAQHGSGGRKALPHEIGKPVSTFGLAVQGLDQRN